MDSLQQKFGGEEDIISKRPKWLPFIVLCVGGAIITATFGYFWWPETAPEPIAEEPIEQPLPESEVETYRASLTVSTTVAESSLSLKNKSRITSTKQLADDDETFLQSEPVTFTPPVTATPVVVAESASLPEVDTVQTPSIETIYVEGDTEVAGVTMTQPDAATLSPIEITAVISGVDVNLEQIVVTANGEVFTLITTNSRLQTKDGKLLAVTSLAVNDILAISGNRLADSPVIQNEIASFIGVQEIVEVTEE